MTGRREIIGTWWQARIGLRESSTARALAARLNRAEGIDILAERAVFDLGRDLGLIHTPLGADRLVALVRVLAAVRTNGGGPLPRRFGQGGTPALSGLRFQRLLRAEGDEFATLIRRALPMVEQTCDAGSLGADLLDWDDRVRGDATRARWAFAYFAAPPPARLASDDPASEIPSIDEAEA